MRSRNPKLANYDLNSYDEEVGRILSELEVRCLVSGETGGGLLLHHYTIKKLRTEVSRPDLPGGSAPLGDHFSLRTFERVEA